MLGRAQTGGPVPFRLWPGRSSPRGGQGMRVLSSVALAVACTLALSVPADADPAGKRTEIKRPGGKKHVAKRHYYRRPRRYSRESVECERARHADPGGYYAGYPCWAREALSPRGNDLSR